MVNYFFSLQSRLGLLNPPLGQTDSNQGVEEGPSAILTASLLNNQPSAEVVELLFSEPEEVDPADYLETVCVETSMVVSEITDKLQANPHGTPVFLGGDHSVGLASAAAIFSQHSPADTLMLMFDSHSDLHQPETSPSGNFHGMWLRPVLSKFSYAGIDDLFPEKLPPMNLVLVGNLDAEQEERDFISKHGVKVFNQQQANSDAEGITDYLKLLLEDKKHLHVSLDIDAIDKRFAPGTGMPCADGLEPEAIELILGALAEFPSKSLEIVELNPRKDIGDKTANLAQRFIEIFA
jgi:arginase